MPQNPQSVRRKLLRAFTLTELMVGLAVLGILGTAIASFYIFSLKSTKTTTASVEMTDKIRNASNQMLVDVRNASRFSLYLAYETGDRVLAGPDEAGNYLVLYFTDIDDAVYRTVGYYIPSGSTEEDPLPLRRHEELWDPPYVDYLTVPLPDDEDTDEHKILMQTVIGLQSATNSPLESRLYINYNNTSILVKGEMLTLNPAGQSGVNILRKVFSFSLIPWSVN